MVIIDPALSINCAAHHTGQYYSSTSNRWLVVRRGFEFQLVVTKRGSTFIYNPSVKLPQIRVSATLSTAYEGAPDAVHVQLTASRNKGIASPNHWSAWLTAIPNTEGEMVLHIQPPADCPVGLWKFVIYVDSSSVFHYVFIICNPYSPADSVHIRRLDRVERYVSSDIGKIWLGTPDHVFARPWVYGQYEIDILETAEVILAHSGLPIKDRSNPAKIVRAVTNVLCHHPDGVVSGLFMPCNSYAVSSRYACQVQPPHYWLGSTQLLWRWYTNHAPVGYVSSWAFSALAVTILRVLGIPCRIVTLFNPELSGHSKFNRSIVMDNFHVSSPWVYHCVLEVFMRRQDLPKGYDGWQVADPYPVIFGKGSMQIGPVPVRAIRRGDIHLGSEVGRLFSVITCSVSQQVDAFYRLIKAIEEKEGDSEEVGKMPKNLDLYEPIRYLVTYKKNSIACWDEMDDVNLTKTYVQAKPSRLARPEKASVQSASVVPEEGNGHYEDSGSRDRMETEDEIVPNGVTVDVSSASSGGQDLDFVWSELLPAKPTSVGQPINIEYKITNQSDRELRAHVVLYIRVLAHSGYPTKPIKRHGDTNVVLSPKSSISHSLVLLPSQYACGPLESNMLRASLSVRVFKDARNGETDAAGVHTKDLYAEYIYLMTPPPLIVKIPDELFVDTQTSAKLSLRNPLPNPITGLMFKVEGPGLIVPSDFPTNEPLPPGQEGSINIDIQPTSAGVKHLVVTALCEIGALTSVHAVLVNVKPKKAFKSD